MEPTEACRKRKAENTETSATKRTHPSLQWEHERHAVLDPLLREPGVSALVLAYACDKNTISRCPCCRDLVEDDALYCPPCGRHVACWRCMARRETLVRHGGAVIGCSNCNDPMCSFCENLCLCDGEVHQELVSNTDWLCCACAVEGADAEESDGNEEESD